MLLLACGFLYTSAHQQWKVSKAMRNNLKEKEESMLKEEKAKCEAEERLEEESKIRNIKTKCFKELRTVFYPHYSLEDTDRKEPQVHWTDGECTEYEHQWV
jgi:hypothetical protein